MKKILLSIVFLALALTAFSQPGKIKYNQIAPINQDSLLIGYNGDTIYIRNGRAWYEPSLIPFSSVGGGGSLDTSLLATRSYADSLNTAQTNKMIDSLTGNANTYSIFQAGGGLADGWLTQDDDRVSLTGQKSLRLIGGTTAQRPTGSAGDLYFNTDDSRPQWYDGSGWNYFSPWVRNSGLQTLEKVRINSTASFINHPLVVANSSGRVALLGQIEITQGINPINSGQGFRVDGANRVLIYRGSGNSSDDNTAVFKTGGGTYWSRTSGNLSVVKIDAENNNIAPISGDTKYAMFEVNNVRYVPDTAHTGIFTAIFVDFTDLDPRSTDQVYSIYADEGRRAKFKNYIFNTDQSLTGLNTTALRYNSTSGEIELQKVLDHDSTSDTTDGSGDITVSHDLGVATITVNATATGTTFYNVQVHSKTTTNFKIRFFDATGAAVTSTAVTADWVARKQ